MDALEIKEIAGLQSALDERATMQYVDGSDMALQIQIDQVESDLTDLENEVVVHETRLDLLEARPVSDAAADRNRANHTGTQPASTVSDFAATVGSLIAAYDAQLQDGVPAAGNTLQKLYNLVLGQFSEVTVPTLAARDALTIHQLPMNVFVTDDGDGRWALYKATSTGVNASFVKLSDPDLLGATLSASQIKAAYESNPDTNAFTNVLLAKLNGLSNYTDAQAASAAKPYVDEQMAALNALLANKTNNATTAALSIRVATLENVLLQAGSLNADKQDWAGLTPLQAIYRLINEGVNGGTTPPATPAAPTGLVVDAAGNVDWSLPAGKAATDYEYYTS